VSTAPQLIDPTVRVVTPPPAPAAIGPDMQELWRRFPPRPAVSSWPATEQTRQELMKRLLSSPLGSAGGRRRWLALMHLLDVSHTSHTSNRPCRVGSWRGGVGSVVGPEAFMPVVSRRVVPLQ